MKVLFMALRFWSYVFTLVLGLFLSGVSLVLLVSGSSNVRLDMLPFVKGNWAVWTLLGLGLLGVIAGLLAALGRWRGLLVLVTLAVFGMLVYGYFMSPVYRFQGPAEARTMALVTLGALGAFCGSLLQFTRARR